MLVAGIDVAAADAGTYVDKVELNHARDVAIVLVVGGAVLGGQLEEHARGQGNHVVTGGGVALAAGGVVLLPLVIGGGAVGVAGVALAHLLELDVAGEVAQTVHHGVDTEVVAVYGIFLVGVAGCGAHGVERHLAHAVDGVVVVVDDLGHAVARSLHHHARAEHACQVGTLDAVEQTTGIDGAETGLLPVLLGLVAFVEGGVDLFRNGLALLVFYAADGHSAFLHALVFKLEVGFLAVAEVAILVKGDLLVESVVVGSVVGNVQLTVAVDDGKVATAVETAGVLGSDGDKVAVVDVAQRCRDVAEHGGGIGIDLVGTDGHVAAGKDGVVYYDAGIADARPAVVGVFVSECVEGIGGHVLVDVVCPSVNSDGREHLCVGFEHYPAVFGELAVLVVIVVVGRAGVGAGISNAFAVDVAYVAAAEHVAVALAEVLGCAHFAATQEHLGASEHIAACVELLVDKLIAAEVVAIAAATAEDVAKHVTAEHLDVGAAGFLYALENPYRVGMAALFHGAAPYGGYLATSVEAVADDAAPHLNSGVVDRGTLAVASAESVAVLLKQLVAFAVEVDVFLVGAALGIVHIAHVGFVYRKVGPAVDGTALAAAIEAAFHGGVGGEEVACCVAHSEGYVCRGIDVGGAHVAGKTAAEGVCHLAAGEDHVCRCFDRRGEAVCALHAAAIAASIKVAAHGAAAQSQAGGSRHGGFRTFAAGISIDGNECSAGYHHVGVVLIGG